MMTQKQKQKNADAVNAFISTKELLVNNGMVRTLKADISYENLKTGKVTVKSATDVYVNNIVGFGGYTVCVAELQDEEGCFVEHNTNFNTFTFANNQLTIIGKNLTNTKGDFSLVVS